MRPQPIISQWLTGTSEMIKKYLVRYEFNLPLMLADQTLNTLCQSTDDEMIIKIKELLEHLVTIIEKYYGSKDYLENLPRELKLWWMNYTPDQVDEVQLETISKTSPVNQSFSDRQLSPQNQNQCNSYYSFQVEQKLLPNSSEFLEFVQQHNERCENHVDFLIKVYQLYSKYLNEFDKLTITQQQIKQLKYQCHLQQISLVFMLTKFSSNEKFQYEDGQIKVNLSSIPLIEVKTFNEQYQRLLSEFPYDFQMEDLQRYSLLISVESFKQLFKKLQDRYEKTIERTMKSGLGVSTTEKEHLILLLYQCIQVFQFPIYSVLAGLNHSLILPELMGYFDEISTIVQAANKTPQLVPSLILNLWAIGQSFRMLRVPVNKTCNYFLRDLQSYYPLRGRKDPSQLNLIMDQQFDNSRLVELYITNIISKELKNFIYIQITTHRQAYYSDQVLQLHTNYMKNLCDYFLIEDAQAYLVGVLSTYPNQMEVYRSCGVILFLTLIKINIKQPLEKQNKSQSFTHKLKQMLEQLHTDLKKQQNTSVIDKDQNTLQMLIASLKLIVVFESLHDHEEINNQNNRKGAPTLKLFYETYKEFRLLEQEDPIETKYDALINQEYEVFGVPLTMMMSGVSELYSLIYLLKQKNYEEFLEGQYNFQMNIHRRICLHLVESYYYLQAWKYMSVLIDVSQRVINMMEMFQINFNNFKDDTLIRTSFSYNHVQRGFKILQLILEESLMRIFWDSSVQDEPQQKLDFKPQIKVMFHGIEDLNIEQPKQGNLDLEIVMQTGKEQFLRLRVQDNQLRIGYSHIEKLNMVINVLMPLVIHCVEFCVQHLPKTFVEFQDKIIKQSSLQAPNLDKSIITTWLNVEKIHFKSAQESFISYLESIEYLLMKMEGSLMREITLHNDRPLASQFDSVGRYMNNNGIIVDLNLLTSWEKKITSTLVAQLDNYIGPVKQVTEKIQGIISHLKLTPQTSIT